MTDGAVEIARYKVEACRIRRAAFRSAELNFAAETPWFQAILWLGIPSTLFSAVAGAAAISKNLAIGWVSSLALISAVLTSLITFLDPSKKAGIHHTLAKSYERLYHQVGYFIRIELSDVGADVRRIRTNLDAFATRLDELNQSGPALPGRAYKKAARIMEGVARGEVLRDLDDGPNPETDAAQNF